MLLMLTCCTGCPMCRQLAQCPIRAAQWQMSAVKAGFYAQLSKSVTLQDDALIRYMQAFSVPELKMLYHGLRTLSRQRGTIQICVQGTTAMHIGILDALKNTLTAFIKGMHEEGKRKFLKWITGSSTIPWTGADYYISVYVNSDAKYTMPYVSHDNEGDHLVISPACCFEDFGVFLNELH